MFIEVFCYRLSHHQQAFQTHRLYFSVSFPGDDFPPSPSHHHQFMNSHTETDQLCSGRRRCPSRPSSRSWKLKRSWPEKLLYLQLHVYHLSTSTLSFSQTDMSVSLLTLKDHRLTLGHLHNLKISLNVFAGSHQARVAIDWLDDIRD